MPPTTYGPHGLKTPWPNDTPNPLSEAVAGFTCFIDDINFQPGQFAYLITPAALKDAIKSLELEVEICGPEQQERRTSLDQKIIRVSKRELPGSEEFNRELLHETIHFCFNTQFERHSWRAPSTYSDYPEPRTPVVESVVRYIETALVPSNGLVEFSSLPDEFFENPPQAGKDGHFFENFQDHPPENIEYLFGKWLVETCQRFSESCSSSTILERIHYEYNDGPFKKEGKQWVLKRLERVTEFTEEYGLFVTKKLLEAVAVVSQGPKYFRSNEPTLSDQSKEYWTYGKVAAPNTVVLFQEDTPREKSERRPELRRGDKSLHQVEDRFASYLLEEMQRKREHPPTTNGTTFLLVCDQEEELPRSNHWVPTICCTSEDNLRERVQELDGQCQRIVLVYEGPLTSERLKTVRQYAQDFRVARSLFEELPDDAYDEESEPTRPMLSSYCEQVWKRAGDSDALVSHWHTSDETPIQSTPGSPDWHLLTHSRPDIEDLTGH